jgi:DNA gyrase subunit A
MLEIKRKFADERRTDIVPAEDDILLEDLIERHECVITLTHAGYIKRQPADTYSAQNRGGKGIIGMTTKEEDFIEKVTSVHSHSYLMFFTNIGKVHMRKAYQIPEASRTAKGTYMANIIELEDGEKITTMISVPEFNETEYLIMVTKYGIVKKTLLSEYEYQRKGGKRALNLDEGDELVFVMRTEGNSGLVIATKNGSAVRFDERNIRSMGRVARGVRGIKLREGDYVCGVAVVDETKKLITITENGFGKKTEFSDFREMKNRGGMGIVCHNLNEKTGLLAGISVVDDDNDIMMITDQGQMIRIRVSDIPTYSRSARGVIVMRLAEDQHIVNFTKVAKEEPEDEVAPEVAPSEEAEMLEVVEEAVEVLETEEETTESEE